MSGESLRASKYLGRLVHVDFGNHLVSFDWALRLQQAIRSIHKSRDLPDVLIQLQHPPVYTVGKRGQPQDFLVPVEVLQKNGIDIYKVLRGGETTFHGPGQLVLYPIVSLRRLRRGARAYVEGLEDTVVNTLSNYDIKAQGRQPAGRTGVWIEDRKIAALGVQISTGIATHGTALNVSTDLQHFKQIVPCGLPKSPVTSLEQETRDSFPLDEVSKHLRSAFIDVFGYKTISRVEMDRLLRYSTEDELLDVIIKAEVDKA